MEERRKVKIKNVLVATLFIEIAVVPVFPLQIREYSIKHSADALQRLIHHHNLPAKRLLRQKKLPPSPRKRSFLVTFWRPKDNGPRQIKSFKLAYTGPLFPENEMKLEKAQVIKLSSALTLLPNLEV